MVSCCNNQCSSYIEKIDTFAKVRFVLFGIITAVAIAILLVPNPLPPEVIKGAIGGAILGPVGLIALIVYAIVDVRNKLSNEETKSKQLDALTQQAIFQNTFDRRKQALVDIYKKYMENPDPESNSFGLTFVNIKMKADTFLASCDESEWNAIRDDFDKFLRMKEVSSDDIASSDLSTPFKTIFNEVFPTDG